MSGLPGLPLFYGVTFDAFRDGRWMAGALYAFATLNTTYFCVSTLWQWWTIPADVGPN
jgi:hypothetical protein